MRNITYRAKKIETGEWVEGNLVWLKNWKDEPNGCFIISHLAYLEYGEFDDTYTVNPDTVGQYTGLNDKNGKKIFEGDILKIARLSDSLGTYYTPPLNYPVNVVVKWDMCAWMWETLCEDKRYIGFPEAWCHYQCEVIGNIHDNKDLLEVK